MIRAKKIAADLLIRWRRTIPTLIGMSFALAGLGAALTASFMLERDLNANFRATRPANVEIQADAISAETQTKLAALPGVEALDERPLVGLRVELAPGKWAPLLLTIVKDFDHLPLAIFYPDRGTWPPPAGTLLMERDGRALFADKSADHLHVRLPDGTERDLPLAGTLSDPAQHPSTMEMVIYGYVTPETLVGWDLHPRGTRLLIAAAPAAFDRIQATLREDGVTVRKFDTQAEAVYGHQFQIDAILVMLASVAAILGTLCVVLVFDLINSLMTAERRIIGTLRALGAGPWQIGLDHLAGFGGLGLIAGLIALVPALSGGEALAGIILRLLNFNSLSHAPLWMIPALPLGSALFALLITLIRLRPALALPVRDALSRSDLTQDSRLAEALEPLLRRLPPLPRMAAWTLACKPYRTLLTAIILSLGLAFFMTALTLRSSMLQTLEVTRRATAFDVAVMLRAETPRESLETWLKTVPGILHADYWSAGSGTLAGASVQVARVPADAEAVRPDLLQGEWLSADRPDDIVVNQAMLKQTPALHLGGTYNLDGEEVRLAGVVREFAGGRVFALKRQTDSANLILISLGDHSFAAQRAILPKLEGTGVAAVVPAKLTEAIILGHLAPLTGLLLILAGLALLVGGLGLGSAIAVGIAERFREIGVMKAIGARGRAIFLLIMAEGVIVALLGWVVAALVAPMVSRPIVESFGSMVVGYPFEYRSGLAGPLGGLAAALIAALIACLLPTRAALRASVRAALRTE
jgi:hypothetical protein